MRLIIKLQVSLLDCFRQRDGLAKRDGKTFARNGVGRSRSVSDENDGPIGNPAQFCACICEAAMAKRINPVIGKGKRTVYLVPLRRISLKSVGR